MSGNAHPPWMARVEVDFPALFLPQRPRERPRLRWRVAAFNDICRWGRIRVGTGLLFAFLDTSAVVVVVVGGGLDDPLVRNGETSRDRCGGFEVSGKGTPLRDFEALGVAPSIWRRVAMTLAAIS